MRISVEGRLCTSPRRSEGFSTWNHRRRRGDPSYLEKKKNGTRRVPMACQCLTSFASSVLRAPSWQRRRRFFQTDARCLMMALLPGDGEKSSSGRKMVARLTSIGKGERRKEKESNTGRSFPSSPVPRRHRCLGREKFPCSCCCLMRRWLVSSLFMRLSR